jgi:hypothetical protein
LVGEPPSPPADGDYHIGSRLLLATVQPVIAAVVRYSILAVAVVAALGNL